jgi:hypothetical protein
MSHAEPPRLVPTVFHEPVRLALLQQLPAAVVCSLMLDGGYMARVCGCAVAGFWAGAGLLVVQRRLRPSRTDIGYIRWGFYPLLIASFAVAAIWARWIAVS